MNRQQQPDSGMHDTSAHWQKLYTPIYFVYRWYNKGTNKQQQPDSGIHDTSAHCPGVYEVSVF